MRNDDEVRVPPGRKDKRRWCGGHVGREHVPRWQPCNYTFAGWMEHVCIVCGKRLDRCFAAWTRPCRCGMHGGAK